MLTARIAVVVSGGGTNLQALIDAQGRGALQSGSIALVVADRAGIGAKACKSSCFDKMRQKWNHRTCRNNLPSFMLRERR